MPIGNEEEKKIHMSNNEGKKSMMIHCFCKRDQIMQHWLVSDVDVVVSGKFAKGPIFVPPFCLFNSTHSS